MPLTLVWMNTLSKLVVIYPCLNLVSKKLVSPSSGAVNQQRYRTTLNQRRDLTKNDNVGKEATEALVG